MSSSRDSVRSRRYALACALAEAVDEAGQPRTSEAVAELDLALQEAGGDPPDRRINLAAGRMLEGTEPAQALQRYVSALDGDTAQDAASQARALLEASPKPATLAAPITTQEIERVARLARGSEPVTLLASALLRLRGRDGEALELLQHAYEDARPPGKYVVSHLAQTQLDLDRVDETVTLVEREDPDGREPSLQLVRAHALLIRGEYAEALELADRLSTEGVDVPGLAAVSALSLLGLGRLDEARSRLPADDAHEIQLARAIVGLQRREYQPAREAASALLRSSPNDPDVLLVNAQTVVEALDASQEDETSALDSSAANVESPTPGAEVDAARRLMADVARALAELGQRSRWWRTQAAVRVNDGRYRYFSCELQFAQHSGPSLEEIDDVDSSETSYLQDGALMEIKAAVLENAGDDDGAAAALDGACAIFQLSAVDTQRALECARKAHELVATLERSITYAERALFASYETNVVPDAARHVLDTARGPAERSLSDAQDDELERLVNVLAWTRLRLTELAELDGPEEAGPAAGAATLLPWLFAGVAVRPTDVNLRTALALRLGNLDLFAAATLEANAAAAAEPGNDYVASSALTAIANYFGDPEKAAPLLARDDDDDYRNSIELHMFLAAGDRAELEEHRHRPIYDGVWAKVDHAFATALLDGIAAATPNLEAALEALLAERESSIPDSVVIAALLRRRDDAATYLADAEGDPDGTDAEIRVGRLIEQFGFDTEMTAEEFFSRHLELCRAPIECGFVANVTLPLLAAARSGSTGPVRAVMFDRDLLRARIAEFEDLPARSVDELEEHRAGMGSLIVLSDADAGPAELSAAAPGALAAWPEELSSSVGERVVRLVVRRACAKLPLRLVEARLDLGPPVNAADVLSGTDADSGLTVSEQLSIVLLDDSLEAGAREAIAERADDDDVDAAARLIRKTLDDVRPEAEEGREVAGIADYWKVDALLQAKQGDPKVTTTLREAAASVRGELILRLDDLLGLLKYGSETPIVLPVVVEVGDALVPIVDSRQDGGTFLYELIPAMRDRILAGTGVTVPGVRMRSGPTLPPDGYSIQIDEVRVLDGTAPLGISRVLAPAAGGGLDPDGELTDFHPLTGERGLWVLNPVDNGTDGDAPRLSPAEYLIHKIEFVLRTHLARLLGPEEVADLVEQWADDDGNLVSTVLPDGDARLQLTWVLQALVDDGVPITEWRALLTAMREAGGFAAPVVSLVQAVRSRLRDELPGPQTGRTPIAVPPELEAALTGPPSEEAGSPNDPQHEFQRWLRRTVAASGPAIALVTSDEESRERVGALARVEGGLITTLSEHELTPE